MLFIMFILSIPLLISWCIFYIYTKRNTDNPPVMSIIIIRSDAQCIGLGGRHARRGWQAKGGAHYNYHANIINTHGTTGKPPCIQRATVSIISGMHACVPIPNAGVYRYMHDLLELQSCSPQCGMMVAEELKIVDSPLRCHLPDWTAMFRSHPDQQFQHYILMWIAEGFRIGFNRSSPLSRAARNIPSASDHPQEVEEYIRKEVRAANFVGPLPSTILLNVHPLHISRIGVVPKGHSVGKWRIITDLSFPQGCSVNDGIAKEHCSLEYTTVQKVAGAAFALGKRRFISQGRH